MNLKLNFEFSKLGAKVSAMFQPLKMQHLQTRIWKKQIKSWIQKHANIENMKPSPQHVLGVPCSSTILYYYKVP
jgi:hypothetical protein